MRIRKDVVKEQVQQIFSYIQGESADIWEENIFENLELGNVKYEIAKEFLVDLKKEFGEREEEAVKVVELRKLA